MFLNVRRYGKKMCVSSKGDQQVMQKSKLVRKGRKGFTLVEVALAVAVGLIIIGGAVLGYGAVKDNAANSNARSKVLSTLSIVEEYAAGNGGSYPALATMQTLLPTKRPDDYNKSPWGGDVGTSVASGVVSLVTTGFTAGASREAAGDLGAATQLNGVAYSAGLLYGTFSGWGTVLTTGSSTQERFRGYAIGMYDKNGTPWWDAKGGK